MRPTTKKKEFREATHEETLKAAKAPVGEPMTGMDSPQHFNLAQAERNAELG